MIAPPSFEKSLLVTGDPVLAARISSLFKRPRQYFPVMDSPRMARPDAGNEVLRRRNAIVRSGVRNVLLGGMSSQAVEAMRPGWTNCTATDSYEEQLQALRGVVKRPAATLRWGRANLGIGLYHARLHGKELLPDQESSPPIDFVEAGRHLLVLSESGDDLSEVIASNLAFACGASFAVFPELPEPERESWLEELYALGEGGDVTARFFSIAQRARQHLGPIDFTRFKMVLFVTAGFPWGIAIPEVPSTHMYRYPDFGRAIVEGMYFSQSANRGARTALLIDPQTVQGSEIPAINEALLKNRTLTRVVRGPAATATRVQLMLDLLPHDIIILSSHAGDAPGTRITYEYRDDDGRQRRLTVDRATGISGIPFNDKFMVTQFNRFHSPDGVDWRDKPGLAALPVGSAISTWASMDGATGRSDYIVSEEAIPRVIGSMAVQLHDGIWLYAPQGFSPESAPVIINNSCWSWHELSKRATFAGARAYVGSLFPVTDIEAQEVGQALFDRHIGQQLPKALWAAQRDIYAPSARRPYVIIGLPFVAIPRNTSDSLSFLRRAYIDAIEHWSAKAKISPHEEIRSNADRFSRFLMEDMVEFQRNMTSRRPGRGVA